MSTPFTTVYDSFLMKVKDYSFLNLTDPEFVTLLNKIMVLSIPKVSKFLKTDTNSKTSTDFGNTLLDLEVEIIATQMVVEWLSPTINTSEIIKQVMTDKDFKIYSQANHLEQLIKLRNEMKDEVDSLVILLDYSKAELEELNNGGTD